MDRNDAITLGVVSFLTVLLCGFFYIEVSSWDFGPTEVITASPQVKRVIVEVPSPSPVVEYIESVETVTVEVPYPAAPETVTETVAVPGGGGDKESACRQAVRAADQIVADIRAGRDPSGSIVNYEAYRSVCV